MKINVLPAWLLAGFFSTTLMADVDTLSTEKHQPEPPGSSFECSYHSNQIPDKELKLMIMYGDSGCGLEKGDDLTRTEAVKEYARNGNIDSSMMKYQPMNCHVLTEPEHGLTKNTTYYNRAIKFANLHQPLIVEGQEKRDALKSEAAPVVGELGWATVPSTRVENAKCNYFYIIEPHNWVHSGTVRRSGKSLIYSVPVAVGTFAVVSSGNLRWAFEKIYGSFRTDVTALAITVGAFLVTQGLAYKYKTVAGVPGGVPGGASGGVPVVDPLKQQ
ncbi:MAG: hypothetical protein ACR2PT_03345 [Endozoicomonas sp.]